MKITVYGKPLGWQRAGRGRYGQAYDTATNRTCKTAIARLARIDMGAKPLMEGPLLAEMIFYFERGKSVTRAMPTPKPDIDNLAKMVLDGLNGIVYKDDSQVVGINACKFYAEPGTKPRTEVYITEYDKWIIKRKPEENTQ